MELPKMCGKSPIAVDAIKDKRYAWCSCGKSAQQPFCDGSHKGTKFSPIIVDNLKEGNIAWCGCKCSKKSPYCDGAHSKL